MRNALVSHTKTGLIQYINNLRALAIIVVVLAHVTMGMLTTTTPQSFNWWVGNWICLICLWAVPIFVMVSGALLLDESRNEPALLFYKKRIRRIGIPLVFWTVLYLGVRKVFGHEQLTARYVAELIFIGMPHWHMWFIYMIIGLYLVTPVLRVFVRNSSFKERILVVVIIFALASSYSLVNLLYWRNQRSIFTLFIPYIGYYLCGYEIRFLDPKKIPLRYLIAAVLFCAVYIAMMTGIYTDTGSFVNDRFVLDFFSPPVIVMSICIFWAAYLADQRKKLRQSFRKTVAEKVASAAYGIYLLHILVLFCIREVLGRYAKDDNFLLGIVVVSIMAFIICFLVISVIMKIPYLRRIVC